MSTAREIVADPSETFAVAAARIVRARAEEMAAAAEGVLDMDDVERVHDMRVATRRLRAVLELFAPALPSQDLKLVLADVRALADALGRRRDPDVQIESMEAFAAAAPDDVQAGVELVVERLRARQAEGNEALEAALRSVRETALHDRLLALTQAAEDAG